MFDLLIVKVQFLLDCFLMKSDFYSLDIEFLIWDTVSKIYKGDFALPDHLDNDGWLMKVYTVVWNSEWNVKQYPVIKELEIDPETLKTLLDNATKLVYLLRWEAATLSIGCLFLYFLIKNDKRK